MSEHVTHLAVAEDAARLATLTPSYSRHFRYATERFPRAVQLGSITRSGDTFIFPLLKKWRDDWRDEDERSRKLAYIIGWAGHLAGDRTFKPVMRITDLSYYTRGFPGPSHASVYQDAATWQHVYADGHRAPMHPNLLDHDLAGHPAASSLPVPLTERVMGYRFTDGAAALRAFPTEGIDPEKWEEQYQTISSERQRYYVGLERYTEATQTPDASRQRQYLLVPNMYNPEDPLLQLAEQLRAGESPTIDLDEALATSDQQSLYAQSVALGVEFYRAASDYFEGRISEEEGRRRMRTFQPHRESLEYYVKQAEAQKAQQTND